MTPFDFLNSITTTKKDIMVDGIAEKQYVPFVVNRSLSYWADTVLIANEMNKVAHIDNKLQYDFYFNMIRKKKRFTKWDKADKIKDLDLVKIAYGYSSEKAMQVLSLLNEDQLKILRNKTQIGGKTRTNK